jgi:uncharacterized damage-inducible protein DinB
VSQKTRELIVAEFITLDGVIQAPGGADSLLLGRKTWQIHGTAFEPMVGEPFADALNAAKKYVVSRTLTSAAAWRNSTLISGNVVEAVRELKAQAARTSSVMAAASSFPCSRRTTSWMSSRSTSTRWRSLHALPAKPTTRGAEGLTPPTPSPSMTASLLPEFDLEMATTRRLLERLPPAKIEWRPHPKSFPLGHLSQLIARMPGWLTNALTEPSLDLASGEGYSFETPAALLRRFDDNVRGARAAIEKATEAGLATEWKLMMGSRVLITATRGVIVRQTISHLVHHRGQLTVYLRLLDVPIPSIYGPTADEKMS